MTRSLVVSEIPGGATENNLKELFKEDVNTGFMLPQKLVTLDCYVQCKSVEDDLWSAYVTFKSRCIVYKHAWKIGDKPIKLDLAYHHTLPLDSDFDNKLREDKDVMTRLLDASSKCLILVDNLLTTLLDDNKLLERIGAFTGFEEVDDEEFLKRLSEIDLETQKAILSLFAMEERHVITQRYKMLLHKLKYPVKVGKEDDEEYIEDSEDEEFVPEVDGEDLSDDSGVFKDVDDEENNYTDKDGYSSDDSGEQ